ncbi:MAG: hypothetical protein QXD54_00470 [Candidatus Aenigmatarchaeota archaeon]
MPIQADFVIAVGIFLIAITIALSFVLSYVVKYSQYSQTLNLKTIAHNIFLALKLNLTTELYKLPVKITEINGNERTDAIINLTIKFDEKCENKAWISTVRVYDENNKEVEFSIYNETFCEENYLKNSDLVLKSNFSAYQTKIFFIYFSGEKEVKEVNYYVPFEEASGLKVEVFPLQEQKMLSLSKLKGLRSVNYDDLIKSLGNYDFYLEVSEK